MNYEIIVKQNTNIVDNGFPSCDSYCFLHTCIDNAFTSSFHYGVSTILDVKSPEWFYNHFY